MLLAKLKDKLFNNRNSVEVESLEGDIDINDISLQECLDWVNEMKELINFQNGKLYLNPLGFVVLPSDVIVPLSALEDEDENAYFPALTNSAGKFVKVKDNESGFEYSEPSSMELLATGEIIQDNTMNFSFIDIDPNKITNKTILILTYANCFIMTPLSQTGEARTVGNLVYDSGGNSKLGKLKFNLDHLGDNYYINVVTDVLAQFSQGHVPTPYLLALTLK